MDWRSQGSGDLVISGQPALPPEPQPYTSHLRWQSPALVIHLVSPGPTDSAGQTGRPGPSWPEPGEHTHTIKTGYYHDEKTIMMTEIVWVSNLYILQSQVFSVASSIGSKLRPPSSNHWEDTQNAFHCHVYVNIHVCAANQEINDKGWKQCYSKATQRGTTLQKIMYTYVLIHTTLDWTEQGKQIYASIANSVSRPIKLLSLLLAWLYWWSCTIEPFSWTL